MYALLVDDLAGGFSTRHEARKSLDKIIDDPLVPLTEAEERQRILEELAPTWGMTPEAIASQNDQFWDS